MECIALFYFCLMPKPNQDNNAVKVARLLDRIGNGLVKNLKNRFILISTIFIIWIFFLDDYNLIYRYQNWHELQEKRRKKEFLLEEIEAVRNDIQDLFSTRKTLEKFAREKYYMKRDDEDVFIIGSEED